MRRSSLITSSLLMAWLAAQSAPTSARQARLTDLDLTTLMTMDVMITSAARRAQAISDTAAAVFVLTRDDIRRSGATSIPALLRLVPGIEVGQISSSSWAISTRGFNTRFANKLLVLIDGRSVYSPIFSGVHWEEIYEPVEEIERIEVVRGPGGALWGANAVNAVINIITRDASDARGAQVTLGSGDDRPAATHVSAGASVGALGNYRVYIDHFQQNSLNAADSPWRRQQAGARLETMAGSGQITVQGAAYRNELENPYSTPQPLLDLTQRGGNLDLGWSTPSFAGGQFDALAYYSVRVNHQFGIDTERESMLDVDAQYAAPRTGRHLATVGASFRQVSDEIPPSVSGTFVPERTSRNQWSLYAQDDVHFLGDRLRFTAGAKLESFATTGAAFEPTVRALWHLDASQTIWAAVSQVVRTPSRFERDLAQTNVLLPGNPPTLVRITGNDDLPDERIRATEIGWRFRGANPWSIDASAYEQHFTDLIDLLSIGASLEPGPPPLIVVTNQYGNAGHANTRGADVILEWSVRSWLHVQASGSWFELSTPVSGSTFARPVGMDPSHQRALRVRMDPSRNTELDLHWRRISGLSVVQIPGYDSVDARLGWRPTERYEFSALIENVLDHHHIEAFDAAVSAPGNVIGRSFFVRFALDVRPEK
jgi:iron complex outermembrane receptor protein